MLVADLKPECRCSLIEQNLRKPTLVETCTFECCDCRKVVVIAVMWSVVAVKGSVVSQTSTRTCAHSAHKFEFLFRRSLEVGGPDETAIILIVSS